MVRKVKAEQRPNGEVHTAPKTQIPGLSSIVEQEPMSSGSTIRNSDLSMDVDMDKSNNAVTGSKPNLVQDYSAQR